MAEKDDGECSGCGNTQRESAKYGGAGGDGVSAAPVVDENAGGGIFSGSGETSGSPIEKRRRGRPRKFDGAGKLNPGSSHSAPPSNRRGSRRGRGGRHSSSATLDGLQQANTAASGFTPHMVIVKPGQDITGQILTIVEQGREVCVLSAIGSISNVTFNHPSGDLLAYEGRFDILALSVSYAIVVEGGMRRTNDRVSVTLATSDGHVIGGHVAGKLIAATPIQIVVGSFVRNNNSMQREGDFAAPTTHLTPAATVTPISQVAPGASENPYLVLSPSRQPVPEADHSSSSNHGTTAPGPHSATNVPST